MDKLEVVWIEEESLDLLQNGNYSEAKIFGWRPHDDCIALTLHAPAQAEIDRLRGEVEEARELYAKHANLSYHDDPFEDMLQNQAWVMFSHLLSFMSGVVGEPDLMDRGQDAWAAGEVKNGFWSHHRGAAAWIANALIDHYRAIEDRALAAEAEVARLQRLLDDATADNNTAEEQVFTLRGEVERLTASCKWPETTTTGKTVVQNFLATLKDTPHD